MVVSGFSGAVGNTPLIELAADLFPNLRAADLEGIGIKRLTANFKGASVDRAFARPARAD